MSFNRHWLIYNNFHLVDNTVAELDVHAPGFDAVYKLRPLITKLSQKFEDNYIMHKILPLMKPCALSREEYSSGFSTLQSLTELESSFTRCLNMHLDTVHCLTSIEDT